MENSNPMYGCTICKGKFDFDNIRYNTDGKLVCVGCYDRILNSIKRDPSENPKRIEVARQAINEPELHKYICIDCRYKFSIGKGSRVNHRCPYCGSEKMMSDKTDADELIDEVSRNMQDKKARGGA